MKYQIKLEFVSIIKGSVERKVLIEGCRASDDIEALLLAEEFRDEYIKRNKDAKCIINIYVSKNI
jgi:hypothetical protein